MEWLGLVQVNSTGKTWAPFTVEHPLLIIEGTLGWKIRASRFNQVYVFWSSGSHCRHTFTSSCFNSDSSVVRRHINKMFWESFGAAMMCPSTLSALNCLHWLSTDYRHTPFPRTNNKSIIWLRVSTIIFSSFASFKLICGYLKSSMKIIEESRIMEQIVDLI